MEINTGKKIDLRKQHHEKMKFDLDYRNQLIKNSVKNEQVEYCLERLSESIDNFLKTCEWSPSYGNYLKCEGCSGAVRVIEILKPTKY